MSQAVMLGNETYKKRNVVGVWLGLPLVTLGIYSYVKCTGYARCGRAGDHRQCDDGR